MKSSVLTHVTLIALVGCTPSPPGQDDGDAVDEASSPSVSGGGAGGSAVERAGGATDAGGQGIAAAGAGGGASSLGGAGGATSETGTGGAGGAADDQGQGGSSGASGEPRIPAPRGDPLLYVGGRGPLALFRLRLATGALEPVKARLPDLPGRVAAIAFTSDLRHVYLGAGELAGYDVEADSGDLTEINRVPAAGLVTGLAVHPDGRALVVSDFTGGQARVHPVAESGAIGEASQVVGELKTAHMVLFHPSGRFVYIPALDESVGVAQFAFEGGRLVPLAPRAAPAGGGQRHVAWAPDVKFLYGFGQGSVAVSTFAVSPVTGLLTLAQPSVRAAPRGEGGYGAHVEVHPSGRFVYASHRSDHTIALLTRDLATGHVSFVELVSDGIDTPNGFVLDPSGSYLLVGNGGTSTITVFRVEAGTGRLTRVGAPVPAGNTAYLLRFVHLAR